MTSVHLQRAPAPPPSPPAPNVGLVEQIATAMRDSASAKELIGQSVKVLQDVKSRSMEGGTAGPLLLLCGLLILAGSCVTLGYYSFRRTGYSRALVTYDDEEDDDFELSSKAASRRAISHHVQAPVPLKTILVLPEAAFEFTVKVAPQMLESRVSPPVVGHASVVAHIDVPSNRCTRSLRSSLLFPRLVALFAGRAHRGHSHGGL